VKFPRRNCSTNIKTEDVNVVENLSKYIVSLPHVTESREIDIFTTELAQK
jgi:hypothetical protein